MRSRSRALECSALCEAGSDPRSCFAEISFRTFAVLLQVYYHESCQGKSYVYDLDTKLDFPANLEQYVWESFKPDVPLKHCYGRHFRCLGARDYLATFASNRQRMKRPDGSWIKPPPHYPPIMNTISANNLEWFIDMQAGNGVPGVVLNQFMFCKQFNIHLDKMFEDC